MLGKSIKKVIKAAVLTSSWILIVAGLNHLIEFSKLVPEVQIAFLCLFSFSSLLLGSTLYNILNQE